jgi:hypothetical protein
MLNFTASLELGITVRDSVPVGARGSAAIAVSIMGHDLHFSVRVGLNESAVAMAQTITAPFLNIGLEASDGDGSDNQLPGVPKAAPATASTSAASSGASAAAAVATISPSAGPATMSSSLIVAPVAAAPIAAHTVTPSEAPATAPAPVVPPPPNFIAPPYHINAVPVKKIKPDEQNPNSILLLLIPAGKVLDDTKSRFVTQNGFYAVPPPDLASSTNVINDYSWVIPAQNPTSLKVWHYDSEYSTWNDAVTPGMAFSWKTKWNSI